MKFLMIFLMLVGLFGQDTRAGKEVPPGEAFTLRFGEQAMIEGAGLTVRFAALQEDSRCPVDVVCAWAGNARVKLKLNRSEKKAATVSLNTTLSPREASFKGYEVRLVKVDPPRKSDTPINPADYEVTLIVSKRTASE
jgi:hypothetical protein